MIALPEYLIEMVIGFLLPFFRVASFIMVVPIFGNQFVPIRIKLLLSLLVSVLIYPLVGEIPLVEPLSIAMSIHIKPTMVLPLPTSPCNNLFI